MCVVKRATVYAVACADDFLGTVGVPFVQALARVGLLGTSKLDGQLLEIERRPANHPRHSPHGAFVYNWPSPSSAQLLLDALVRVEGRGKVLDGVEVDLLGHGGHLDCGSPVERVAGFGARQIQARHRHGNLGLRRHSLDVITNVL